ncbi:alpha/beta fold hydrolase [Uliginosibacterium sp. 31-16]|uniref:alpha/beta fold hydrolase n=1 Tax=Uliginosibacterium sp. 31-16 TaxID=3068315 RepID=UPI00273EE434|nr:alpha/beta fold hydrolase [Uliginosibacterium sp. 31-16]MDP5239453.1 alpha/beta fold hydrolase [Uliginosibacterium sp. 31-16]
MSQALVLLHGWGYTPGLWDTLQAELPELAITAPFVCPTSPDLRSWTADISETLPDNAWILGWSLGATLAISLAAHHPEKVRGLFLIGATPRFVADEYWKNGLESEVVEAFRTTLRRSPERIQKRFLALQLLGDRQPDGLVSHLGSALADIKDHVTELEAGLQILAETDLRTLALPPGLPVQFLHGRHDAVTPLAAAQYLHACLPGAGLHVCEEAGHAPLLAQPVALAALIREFVNARQD